MIVRAFADTNIAVYCLDADLTRRTKALAVMRSRPVISVQVVNEFLTVVLRQDRLPRETVIRPVEMAFRIGNRYQIAHWDSLIIAVALAAGCDTLFSEDLQHGQVFDEELTVINPFL
jgi:predicted nucleic acid-binding protein